MKLKTLIITAVVVALAIPSLSLAQGGGQRGQGGGQRGGGQFGMGGQTNLGLLGRADVQKDLKMTAEQIAAIQKIRDAQQEKMRARFEEMRNGGGGGDFQAMRDEMEKMNKANDEEALKLLDDKQKSRLQQISVQMGGVRVILRDEKIQKALGLTAQQKTDLDKLQASQQQANQELGQRMRNQEISREEFTAIREKNDKILDEEILKILTQAQKDTWASMQGDKFERDPKVDEAMRGGRGGGGGGN